MKKADSAIVSGAVALPRILTRFGDAFTDTVFIRSDSMVVSKDLKVYLQFYDDANDNESMDLGLIDSAGYKYKSRWTANMGVSPAKYYRQFPANSTAYRWWNKTADSCLVSFRHDSLYAVGGKLTILCKGSLNHLDNIDNRFSVVTDSVPLGTNDSIQTKMILIDKDPANTAFLTSLSDNVIKAIAWVEYAGSNDAAHHCHNPYNPQYNSYWEPVITPGDTCIDSLTPCESRISTATGIMQMLRGTWERAFRRRDYIPQGYYQCIWDSLAWDWRVNIQNGRFIYFTDNFYRINNNPAQRTWDSTCTQCNEADSIPSKPNKEDLSVYGYKYGFPVMDTVTTKNWKNVMTSKAGEYVRDVRGSKYAKPWQN
jgi:hypothetical protein